MLYYTCYTTSSVYSYLFAIAGLIRRRRCLGWPFHRLGLSCSRDLVCVISRKYHFNLSYYMIILTCYTTHVILHMLYYTCYTTSSVYSYLFAIAGLIRRRRCLGWPFHRLGLSCSRDLVGVIISVYSTFPSLLPLHNTT
jgi:hypothetical protein